MVHWSQGYVDTVEYINTFAHELLPEMMRFAALSAGIEVTASGGAINYCELGCGQGFAINLNAAANPHMRFYANDFNPAHIAGARRLASEAGIDNIRFYDHSFEEFLEERDLPAQFDIIALHGIWSWVSPLHRQHILTFICRKLKVGGLVYVSYNAMPGWASAAPLRHLIHRSVERGQVAGVEAMRAALANLQTFEAAGSVFLDQHPLARAKIQELAQADIRYLVHEYLNDNWNAFYFDEVASEFDSAKCKFVGSANARVIIQKIGLTQPQRDLLETITDVSQREVMQDMLVNRRFRRDVFGKGLRPFSMEGWIEAWRSTRIVLLVPPAEAEMTLRENLGQGPTVDCALLISRHLQGGACLVADVLKDTAFEIFDWRSRIEALILLVGFRLAQPCAQVPDEESRKERIGRFNAVVAKRGLTSTDWKIFASPVTGGGVKLNRLEQLFVSALHHGAADPVEFVSVALQKLGEPVNRNATQQTSLEEHYTQFQTTTLERLRALGVVD